jgi:hypothetical protein
MVVAPLKHSELKSERQVSFSYLELYGLVRGGNVAIQFISFSADGNGLFGAVAGVLYHHIVSNGAPLEILYSHSALTIVALVTCEI